MKSSVLRISALAFFSGLVCLLAGCATIHTAVAAHITLKSEAAPVRIHFQEEGVRNCSYLGEVVGSAGHWYNSWFIANDVLVNASLNDMRKQAYAKGADTLFVAGNTWYFQTSVTMLGQAYQCKK